MTSPFPRWASFVVALLALAGTAPAGAHDLWLVPSAFRPEPGATLSVQIVVGHGPADGQPLARDPEWVERFLVRGPAGEEPVSGVAGVAPAGYLVAAEPGLYAVGLESRETRHALSAEAFRRFLAEEGLEGRAQDREVASGGFVREEFSRSVKSLLSAGTSGPSEGFDRPLGLELELVPLSDPFDPTARELLLAVLHHGEPAPGVLVDLRPLRRDTTSAVRASAVSGEGGQVRLPMHAPSDPGSVDAWLAAAVVLEPAPEGDDADWRSVWTSLTFARGSR